MKDLEEESEESSESDSVEEDDDAELTKYVAKDFLGVLPLIAAKHPDVYKPETKFFPGASSFGQDSFSNSCCFPIST